MFDIEPEDMLNVFLYPKSRPIPMTQEEMLEENTDELIGSLLEKEASLTDEERISPDTGDQDVLHSTVFEAVDDVETPFDNYLNLHIS